MTIMKNEGGRVFAKEKGACYTKPLFDAIGNAEILAGFLEGFPPAVMHFGNFFEISS
jgi:hypothetical protein